MLLRHARGKNRNYIPRQTQPQKFLKVIYGGFIAGGLFHFSCKIHHGVRCKFMAIATSI